ncbi:MAG: HAD family hydrolase [Lachnospiraceae bacterium]|nr:HAD family hydrolase [Lachnospiraceae bacterium]
MKAQLPYHYHNYIFDLYGTLVDIHTDEENPMLWDKMCLFYGYYGADYSPEELRLARDALTEQYRQDAGRKHGSSASYTVAQSYSDAQQDQSDASCQNFHIHQEQISRVSASDCITETPARQVSHSHNHEEHQPGNEPAMSAWHSRLAQDYEASPEIDLSCVIQALYEQKGIIASPELILHTGQFFRVLSTEYIRLYEGTLEMLEYLHAAGKKVWLLSNAQRIFTQYELRLLDLDQRFDGILISSDYGVGKPNPFFFHQLTRQFGLDFSQSLFIGNDAVNDIGGAMAAGLDSFYVHSNLSFVLPDWINKSGTNTSANSSGSRFAPQFGTYDVNSSRETSLCDSVQSSRETCPLLARAERVQRRLLIPLAGWHPTLRMGYTLRAPVHKKTPGEKTSSAPMRFQLGDTVNYTVMNFTGWALPLLT